MLKHKMNLEKISSQQVSVLKFTLRPQTMKSSESYKTASASKRANTEQMTLLDGMEMSDHIENLTEVSLPMKD